MQKFTRLLIITAALLFFFPTFVFSAGTLTLVSVPDQVTAGEEFTVYFRTEGFDEGTYYVKARIGLQDDLNEALTLGSTGNWLYDTSSWSDFPTVNSSASASISVKSKLTTAPGPNLILVRIKKTDSATVCSTCDSNQGMVNILPAPTATSTPTNTPTPVPTNTSTPAPTSTPTLSPTPNNTNTPTPTNKPTLSPTPTFDESKLTTEYTPDVLAEETTSTVTVSPTPTPTPTKTNISGTQDGNNSKLPIFFIGGGIVLLAISGLSLVIPGRKTV